MGGLFLSLAAILLAAFPAIADGDFTVHSAVFSARQTFWPGLAGPPDPAGAGSRPGSSAGKVQPGKPQSGKSSGKASGKDEVRDAKPASLKLVVLPIRIAPSQWRESIPCDSCHRLSANGMEFFLENYLAERLRRRFPGQTVELAAPHDPLLRTAHLNLLDYQDSLRLPWDRWFDGYAEGLVFRPRDAMTSPEDVRRLDKLGGLLGATHLLLPAKVWVKIEPRGRNVHSGDLDWGFHLMFWNVAEGRVEWAMALSERAPGVDLDAALDSRLDKALVGAWERMPSDLLTLWNAEPR